MLKCICLALLVACVFADEREDKLERKKRALGVSMSTFKSQNLNCHNKYRSIHQAGPLVYTSTLNNYAQNYANQLASTDNWKHSGGPYGENLYYSTGNVDGNSACESWYAENKLYDYSKDNPNNFADVGHFTQLVWKNTKQIGVGAATSRRTGRTYVVASYSPPGNYKNQYRANVLPPRSG